MTDTHMTVRKADTVAATRGLRIGWRVIAAYIYWTAVVINGGVIVVLWARGGNLSGVHSLSVAMTSAGRITGLLGAYLLLLQVVLLARVVWIERLSGFDRLTVLHRLNGKICLYLILVHVVFITLGYALTDRLSIAREALQLITTYPGMVTGTVGTVLLTLVVITSLVIVRRRLRYETWYLVHLLAYAGIVLAWFHQIPTGNEFITNSLASAYWTALYVVTAALLLVFRLVRPAAQAARHRLRVTRIVEESPDTVSIYITGRHLDRLGARAGQFFLWRFWTRGRWWQAHPFSLSAAPDGRSLRITLKKVGDFTGRIHEIKPGTRLSAEGPFGLLTEEIRGREGAVLIAGGIGITPIRSLAEVMSGDVIVVYRVLDKNDVVFREELEDIADRRGIRVVVVDGDHRTAGNESLLSADHLCRLIPDIQQRDVYVCGPPGMVTIIDANVRRAGVPPRNIHIERFAF